MDGYLFTNYARKPFELVEGKGSYVLDNYGKKYLDFTSGIGVVNLGHNVKQLNQVLADQAAKIWHTSNLYENHLQEEVAEKLANKEDYLAYFCNSGAEANEAAIKLARKASGRSQIISCKNSFHGRTYGAMTATGQPAIHAGFEPLVPDFDYVSFNDIDSLEEKISVDTAAVMLELIQGEGGIVVAQPEWLQAVQDLCKKYQVLLIIDEVQTGIGRTGTLYAFEQFGIEPDIFTLAKGLGNGFPVAAMLGKKELKDYFGPGSHGTTFGGNQLAMAVASQVLDLMQEVLPTVEEKSELLFNAVKSINSVKIKEIRGLGLMLGIELSSEYPVAKVLNDLETEGMLALRAGANTLRLMPALTISESDLLLGVEIIRTVLTAED